ncbi:MAG: S41 family peptidase [Clostridia bacterium]|nr:S41 family peptidase [Clostridia bacterium]
MKKHVLLLLISALLIFSVSVYASGPRSFIRGEEDTVTISREEYERYQQFSKLDLLLQIVDAYYYEDADREKMLDGAAAGLMDGIGDVYSCYYTKEQMDKINEESTGVYAGVGCQLLADPETMLITVTRVFKGSPAEDVGIRTGDKIVYVNDEYYSAREMDDAVSVMRGHVGESVKITVLRDLETIDFEPVRREVNINYVEYEILPENIGYIILYDFYGDAAQGFKEALEKFAEAGVKGVIIDLRNNGGGIVDIAVDIADQILPEGVVVSTRDKAGTEEKMTVDAEHYDFPLAVLVNQYSASASEILAGAIRDDHAGILVGTKTFGKGVIQAELQFTDGTGMKVTMARYYTPSGECIHEVGIEPDVDIELNKDAVTRYGYNNLPHDQDNQLQTAVRILTGESTLEAEKAAAEAIKAEKKAEEEANATAELDAALEKGRAKSEDAGEAKDETSAGQEEEDEPAEVTEETTEQNPEESSAESEEHPN